MVVKFFTFVLTCLVLSSQIVSRELIVHEMCYFHADCRSAVTRCGLSRKPNSEILSTRNGLFYAWNFQAEAVPRPKTVKSCPLEESPAVGGVYEYISSQWVTMYIYFSHWCTTNAFKMLPTIYLLTIHIFPEDGLWCVCYNDEHNVKYLSYRNIFNFRFSRSQRPCGLRHKMSSLAQTLWSWVWILLQEWICVCISSVFVFSCAVCGLATRLISFPRSPTDCL
jgi:hypothetical protein